MNSSCTTHKTKFYNPNLHNIARSDRKGFKTKNHIVESYAMKKN